MMLLKRLLLKIRYPDVCWKHKRMMNSDYCGYSCADCIAGKEQAARDKQQRRLAKLKAMGVKHALH